MFGLSGHCCREQMPSGADVVPAFPKRAIAWFVVIELACAAGFIAFLTLGRQRVAFACLLGPLQLLAWVVLMRDEYWILMFFNVLVMLTPMELLPRYYVLFGLFPGTALLLAFSAATGFIRPGWRRPARLAPWEVTPVVVLFLWIGLSAVHALQVWGWKGWATYNMLVATSLGLEAVLIGYFYATVPRSIAQIHRLVLVLVGGTLLAAVAVYFLPAPLGEGGALGGKVVVTPFGEASLNALGSVLAASSGLLVGLLVYEGRPATRALLGVFLLVLVVTLVITKSRGAWFGFGVASLCVLFVSRSRWLLAALAAVALAVLSIDVLRHLVVARTAETTARDPSLAGRLLLWSYGWKVARANWLLGVGMDYFRAIKHSYRFPSPFDIVSLRYNTHNLYLEVLANLGVVGLSCFLWMLVGAIRRVLSRSLRVARETRGLSLGIGAALVALAMHGLWDAVIWQYGVLMLIAILIGMATSLHRLSSGRPAEPSHPAVSQAS